MKDFFSAELKAHLEIAKLMEALNDKINEACVLVANTL